jgi:hydroxymethylpyrimidine/phosphomethylpyrimidine kinase
LLFCRIRGEAEDPQRAIYDSDPVQASQIASDDNRSRVRIVAVGGLDPGGGAGLVRDALTAAALGARAHVVATAWTEQGPEVHRIETRDADALRDSVRQALITKPAAVKVGMVPDPAAAAAIVDGLRNFEGPIVVDPVLESSRGRPLFQGRPSDLGPLLARATIVTPNGPEAAALAGLAVADVAGAAAAARALTSAGLSAVLIKGGHLGGPGDPVTDTLLAGGELHLLSHARVGGEAVRGTGCALATAIAVHLGRGAGLLDAVRDATDWLGRSLAAAVDVGGERHLG